MGQQESVAQGSTTAEEAQLQQQFGLTTEDLKEVREWQAMSVQATEHIGRRFANTWCPTEAAQIQRCLMANKIDQRSLETMLMDPASILEKPCGKQVMAHTDCWEKKYMNLITDHAEKDCQTDLNNYEQCLEKNNGEGNKCFMYEGRLHYCAAKSYLNSVTRK